MSEQDGRTPGARRPRPVYGLPADPSAAPPAPQPGAPQPAPPAQDGTPAGSWGAPASAWQSPPPAAGGPGPWGPGGPGTDGSGTGGQHPAAAGRRRRGIVPLVLGLVMLLVLAPAALVIGLVLSVDHLVGDAVAGPTPMPGGTATVEVPGSSMVIVYVAEADAATAECTATGEGGTVTVVPQSSTVQFGDGSTYHQVLGAVAQGDTTMTLSCTGVTADPGYLGPYSMYRTAGPMFIGLGGGVLLGLIGLVLLIIGIVALVRSRRS